MVGNDLRRWAPLVAAAAALSSWIPRELGEKWGLLIDEGDMKKKKNEKRKKELQLVNKTLLMGLFQSLRTCPALFFE